MHDEKNLVVTMNKNIGNIATYLSPFASLIHLIPALNPSLH
jgi:hypothetical protein